MRSTAAKCGSAIAADDGLSLQISRFGNKSGENSLETEEKLRQLAQEIVSEVTKIDPFRRKELLGTLISEVYSTIAEQERRAERRQRHAEAAAAAKARGVRIGRKRDPLPEGFEELAKDWFNGCVTAVEAGKMLGMSRQRFSRRATEWAESAGAKADVL